MALFVYAISQAPFVGWSAARTILLLLASALLILGFLVIESRVRQPLIPLRMFRVRTIRGANTVGFLVGATVFANWVVLTLYVQDVLGFSALRTGVTFVAATGAAMLGAGVAQALVTRVGVKPVILIGVALIIAGMAWNTQIPVDGSFASDLLPGYLLVGVGIPFSFVPVSIAALAGISHDEAGFASGLFNTSRQIGGSIGVAVVATVFSSQLAGAVPTPETLTHAYALAFWPLVGFAVAALLATLLLIQGKEATPAAVTAPESG